MNSQKRTHADFLKNPSAALNPGMDPQPLIRKEQRVRLSASAKSNLRAAIQGKPMLNPDKPTNPVVKVQEPVKSLMDLARPLVLASASAGILPGFVMDDRRFMQSSVNSAGVRLLKANELSNTFIEGKKRKPNRRL